jgi:hypothetical protein
VESGRNRRSPLILRSAPHPGDFTTITVTYYDVVGADGRVAPFETFTLRRPRRDGA